MSIKKSIQITKGVIGFILLLVASLLQWLLMPLMILYGWIRIAMIRDAKRRDTLFGNYNRELAIVKDVMGNVAGRFLFNDILRKENGYLFGKRYETISSALGKNKRANKLTWIGCMIACILDAIDKDHCEKSINFDDVVVYKTDILNEYFIKA